MLIVRTATVFDKHDAEIRWSRVTRYVSTRSTIVAIPCPTPMHIVARP
jgi:hypothetical protein